MTPTLLLPLLLLSHNLLTPLKQRDDSKNKDKPAYLTLNSIVLLSRLNMRWTTCSRG